MNTRANVNIDGTTAVLTQGDKRLTVRFTGKLIKVEVVDISAPRHDYDQPNPNFRQLVVSGAPDPTGTWTLGTRFSRS